MSQFGRGYDINQTFVIEEQDNNLPIFSACTAVYTNFMQSCSGDTQIFLGTGVVSINGNLATNSVSATTYYGDGSNLTGISSQDTFVTGGTYNNGQLELINNTGGTINIGGFFTPSNDVYVTGGTYSNGIATFTNNTGGTFSLSGFFTQSDDIYVTGGTYSAGTAVFTNNTGGTFSISGFSDAQTFTGGTVIGFTEFLNGLSALTVSATTYYGDGSNLTGISTQDTFVTGGTHDKNNGFSTFSNNTGGTFNVSGYFTPSDDIFTTGLTFNGGTYDLNIVRNDGNILSTNLAILASDMTITGGTYNPNTGVATFTNNTGGTFTVSGFLTGQTDTYVTGLTFTNNILTLKQTNNQSDINVLINNLSGLTINGSLSATTYLGLPLDVNVTGGTYSNGVTTFTNNTGGTFNVVGYYTGYTLTSSEIILALGYTPLSAYTDTFVTGGTYSAGTAVFINNTGGTFTITGFTTGSSSTFTGGTVSGPTQFTNGLTANTFSATTYFGLPIDVYVTGGTYSAGTATFTNNTGGTFNVVGFSTGGGEFSGGTVTGSTIFTNGLSANTFSATTYLGLPLDITVTGGTYSNGTAIFTNNTGGTFSISGFSTGYTLTSSEIISALGYTPLSAYTDTFVTGGTYSAGTAVFTNNTGGTFNTSGFFTSVTDDGNGVCTIDNTDPLNPVVGFNGVYVDGVTITGDGSVSSPLKATLVPGKNLVLYLDSVDQTWTATALSGDILTSAITTTQTTVTSTDNGNTRNVINFISGPDFFESTIIPDGFWLMHLFGSRDAGTVSFYTDIYYVDNDGVSNKTLITSGALDPVPITNTTPVMLSQSLFSDIITLSDTNKRLIIEVFVITGSGNRTTTFYFRDSTISHIHTPLTTPSGDGTTFTGGTVDGPTNFTGGLTANTFSATTYLGLPPDVYITGGTYNAGTALFTNNTGGTFSVSGFSTGGGTDVYVTGGTYNAGTALFTNNTGGTFSVSGFSTGGGGGTDVFVTGGTFDSGAATLELTNNTGGTFSVTGVSTTSGSGSGVIAKSVVIGSASTPSVETVIDTIFIPANTFTDGDIWKIVSWGRKSALGLNWTWRVYTNTTNTLTGANNIARGNTNNPSFGYVSYERTFFIESSATTRGSRVEIVTGYYTDFGGFQIQDANYTIDWTVDQYILITATTGGAETVSSYGYIIEKY